MANEHGLFWDSYGGDRLYNAESMEEWLKPFFVTGVFMGNFSVTPTSGMGISVSNGYCNINGKVKFFDDATTFTLDPASSARTDTVVIERNDGDREITLKVVKGESTTPTPPVREGGVYQLVLAQINIANGAISISANDITDTRASSSLCGYVTAAIDNYDIETIYEIYKDKFEDWFEHLQNELDSNQAAHLQNEIDHKAGLETWESITLTSASWTLSNGAYIYSLESLYPSNSYDILDVLPNNSTTAAMRNAWILADCGGYEATNIIKCYGKVPDIDIVIGISVRAK